MCRDIPNDFSPSRIFRDVCLCLAPHHADSKATRYFCEHAKKEGVTLNEIYSKDTLYAGH